MFRNISLKWVNPPFGGEDTLWVSGQDLELALLEISSAALILIILQQSEKNPTDFDEHSTLSKYLHTSLDLYYLYLLANITRIFLCKKCAEFKLELFAIFI